MASIIRLHPSTKASSLTALLYDLDAPKMLANTPIDPKIKTKRQFICSFIELAKALNKSRSDLLAELTLLGLDFESLSRADELELHLSQLPPGGIFPPHLHFIGGELYFGLMGEGQMRIGHAMQSEKEVKSTQDVSSPASLSCVWSKERSAPLLAHSAFMVQVNEVHSLTNPSSSDLYFAFICGGWHMAEGGDRLFLPSVH
ncbi:Uncharacterised protein [uncultured archaeon]|nr:Uncharacterised protein [uncultured archaeon]